MLLLLLLLLLAKRWLTIVVDVLTHVMWLILTCIVCDHLIVVIHCPSLSVVSKMPDDDRAIVTD